MGRHGKNLKLTAPVAKPEYNGIPELDRLLTVYEKQLLKDDERKLLYEQAVASVLAVTARVLIYHYDDIKVFGERLDVFYKLFLRYYENLATPDMNQRFSEWYWEVSTGYDLIRQNDLEEKKMAKAYQDELAAKLKEHINKYIAETGCTVAEVVAKSNVKQGKYYNMLGGKHYTKEDFDKVAKVVGFEMDDETKKIYNARFGTKRAAEENEFEAMACELEAAANKQQKAEEEFISAAPSVVKLKPEALKRLEGIKCIVEEAANAPDPVSVDEGADLVDKAKDIVMGMVEEAAEELKEEQEGWDEMVAANVTEAKVHVPEGLDEAIQAVEKADELPYVDCNEMYKEAEKEEPQMPELKPSNILKNKINTLKEAQAAILEEIKETEVKLHDLRCSNTNLIDKVDNYKKVIEELEAMGE